MAIGLPVARQSIDGRATDLAQQWETLILRTSEFYSKVSGDLSHDGLVAAGYSDTAGTGEAGNPSDTEAAQMLRMSNYLGDLVKLYQGDTALAQFNYSDALKAVRGLGR